MSSNVRVLIFQKNLASIEERATAWVVIDDFDPEETYSLTFEDQLYIRYKAQLIDEYTVPFASLPGDRFIINSLGNIVRSVGSATDPSQIELTSNYGETVNGAIGRSGKILHIGPSMTNGQTTAFKFDRRIWIGVVSEIEERDNLDADILGSINTEINLTGIASADIVMTGGGVGRSATPFSFSLANIVPL
jgi:hypothetical protein